MEINQRVELAKTDKNAADQFILEYTPFIKAVIGNYIIYNKSQNFDDLFSVAMQAFYQAILSYNSDKGYFISFAKLVIKRRLLNEFQKNIKFNKEIPFNQMEYTDSDGNNKEFDVADVKAEYFDNPYKLEIDAIKSECLPYNINFLTLEKYSPKAEKTKLICMKITDLVATNNELLSSLKRKAALPTVKIIETLKVSKKILERHRHYLIAVIIIKTGDYPYLKEYLKLGDKN